MAEGMWERIAIEELRDANPASSKSVRDLARYCTVSPASTINARAASRRCARCRSQSVPTNRVPRDANALLNAQA